MTRESPGPWTIRRRAVVAGRVPLSAVPTVAGSHRLALSSVPEARRFEGRLRRDGRFFFLDIPPGQYTFDWRDASGKVLETTKVSVAPYAADARMPVVQIDLDVAGAKAADRDRVVGRRKPIPS